jgi:hypothetical protein
MCVPIRFPIAPHFYPIMVCPKFNSHVYKLKRWAIMSVFVFYFATGGPKRCFYWGSAQCSEEIGDGPINMAPSKRN